MKEEKKESPIGVLWGWGKPYHGKFIGSIILGGYELKDIPLSEISDQIYYEMCIRDRGYQTNIGENGSALSGGERQRISIARALLKNAPIVLLDEATASMDAESETLVQDALSVLLKDKTVMVIAHRMRTGANADKIVVLDDGQVSEMGTPAELMKKDGLYAHLVKLQQGR